MLLLHLLVLRHQWSVCNTLRFFYLIFGGTLDRFRRGRFRRGRCKSPVIIEVQIEAQFQRFIECLPHIGCNTINSALMLIDDSRFAELVCANLCLRAYNILWKRRKIFIVGNFCHVVNNGLDKKFLIGRQRFFVGMLLKNNQV